MPATPTFRIEIELVARIDRVPSEFKDAGDYGLWLLDHLSCLSTVTHGTTIVRRVPGTLGR
jgi:hypothetical protein